MKIIGGEFKGRRIEMPKGRDKIRPTSDKVREALFNIIKNRVKDASVLDLFAGSGSLGIEALSRGAERVTFVDIQKNCINIIRKNIRDLPVKAERVDILHYDAQKAIKKLNDSKIRFDIIFLDPPYYSGLLKKYLITLDKYDILKNSPIVICEHFKKDIVSDEVGRLRKSNQRRYGDTVLSFYIKASGSTSRRLGEKSDEEGSVPRDI